MENAINNSNVTMFKHPLKWFKQQITGWHTANYCLFWFAVGSQLMIYVTNPIDLLSTVTFFGTLLGTLCIVSINAAKSINGILGLISASCKIYVGYKAQNYLVMLEELAYIVTLDLPVILSVKSWNEDTVHNLKKFTRKNWIISLVSVIIIWILSSYLIGTFTNDPRPIIDGLSFAVSVTGGVICFLRYNNQYFWWTFSSIFQIILWAITYAQGDATIAMLVSSSVYLINDIIAFTVSPWFNTGRKKMGLEEIR